MIIKFKLFENPNYINKLEIFDIDFKGNAQIYNHDYKGNIIFGYFEGELKHLVNGVKYEFNKNSWFSPTYTHEDLYYQFCDHCKEKNIRYGRTTLSGRIFVEAKIISFWYYPKNKAELKKICEDIKKDTGLDIWKDDWKIEIYNGEKEINDEGWRNRRWYDSKTNTKYTNTDIIAIKDYVGSEEVPEEELEQEHDISPMKKKRIKEYTKNKPIEWRNALGKYRGENMIQKFNDYINENNIEHDEILFIVDVQKEFAQFIQNNLVEELKKYAEHFTSVYQIWDSNKAKSPSYKFPNEKGTYIKKYGTSFSDDFKEVTNKLNKKYPNAIEGDIFEFENTGAYVVRVKNNHGWFYVPKELSDLFISLKGKKVVVVGGGENECLKDVYEAMESFEMYPIYNNKYIYGSKTSNKQKI